MIQDPDYSRIFTQARCIAWQYGYAAMVHGSFTRDLDLLFVPWTDDAKGNHEQIVKLLIQATKILSGTYKAPSIKPHGRLVYTLTFSEFGDRRFVDLGFMETKEKE